MTAEERRARLRKMMFWHGLKAPDVAKLIHRSPVTVRTYMCGKRPISDGLLEVLEEKLNQQNEGEQQWQG